jgi:hypothetical protein
MRNKTRGAQKPSYILVRFTVDGPETTSSPIEQSGPREPLLAVVARDGYVGEDARSGANLPEGPEK